MPPEEGLHHSCDRPMGIPVGMAGVEGESGAMLEFYCEDLEDLDFDIGYLGCEEKFSATDKGKASVARWKQNAQEALPVSQLKGLTHVILLGCETIPPEMMVLTDITHLYLKGSKTLGPALPKLPSLSHLHLEYVDESLPANILQEVAQITGLKSLSIRKAGLTEWPMEISSLPNLKALYLCSNQLKGWPLEMTMLSKLTSLSLDSNQLTGWPSQMAPLSNLTRLDLDSNQLTEWPSQMAPLSNLTELYLQNNQLTGWPSKMAPLSNLTKLCLSDNQLTAWPSEMALLSKLTRLDLDNNQLAGWPSEMAPLSNLTSLDLDNNQLTAWPSEMAPLSNLTQLCLGGNQLTGWPMEMTPLSNLTRLDLDKNQLTGWPSEMAPLSNLTKLFLDNNQLMGWPSEMAPLSNLTQLYLGGNQLTGWPSEMAPLSNLTQLFLHSNQLTTLPSEIGQFSKLITLYIDGNPLVSPPLEIADQGLDAIRAYFQQAGATRPLSEVKMVLVGHGAAGKTSLVRALLGEPFDPGEGQTHGINIRDYPIPTPGGPVRARTWDFGGQEIMHATHQFFLSRRSLFLVVLEGRRDEDPEYWLNHARSYSSDAPVLVVLNKDDQNTHYQLDFKRLREKFPQIRGFYRTSCKTGRGIAELQDALSQHVEDIPLIRTQWPESWIQVKDALETHQQPYLSHDGFSQLCDKAGIDHQAQKDMLVEFFNDLGVAVHFKDLHLYDTHVLKPDWATNGVYRILNHPEVARNLGLANTDGENLKRLLEPVHPDQKACDPILYPVNKQGYLVELMKKFELCFSPSAAPQILIPDLLPKAEPDFDFDYGQCKFRCVYQGFLPPTVLPRLMVKRHEDIQDALRWRTGMVLKARSYDARAVVRSDRNEKRLEIWVEGKHRREYLASLRESLAAIHQGFSTLEIVEKIGCPCSQCTEERNPYFHDYDMVLGFYVKGHSSLPCKVSMDPVPLSQILDGVGRGMEQKIDEMMEFLKFQKIESEFEGSQWDKIVDAMDPKFGLGPLKVDLKKLWALKKG